jgi:hypothetical protein
MDEEEDGTIATANSKRLRVKRMLSNGYLLPSKIGLWVRI